MKSTIPDPSLTKWQVIENLQLESICENEYGLLVVRTV